MRNISASIESQEIQPGHYIFSATQSVSAQWFQDQWWDGRGICGTNAPGRGNSRILPLDEHRTLVWRHYLRGGIVSRWNRDRYLWCGVESSRPYRELLLTRHLREIGLPVPEPIGGQVVRHGFWYRGDILTGYIDGSMTLDRVLLEQMATDELWQRVGSVIRCFHQAGLDHVDLNIRNILIDDEWNVFLIDFDRCRLRQPKEAWQRKNLQRLRRSLVKLGHFTPQCWQLLLQGYAGRC